MATVNLSWTVEGLHDGIRVERSFMNDGMLHKDYLDTLPAGTTEFEDDFSISELADHYGGILVEDLDLLTYTLTTFRGEKEKSTVVPVPVEDTDPEWLVYLDLFDTCGVTDLESELINGNLPFLRNEGDDQAAPYAPYQVSPFGENTLHLSLVGTVNESPLLIGTETATAADLRNVNINRLLNAKFNSDRNSFEEVVRDHGYSTLAENPFDGMETYSVSMLHADVNTDESEFSIFMDLFSMSDEGTYFMSLPFVDPSSSDESGMRIYVVTCVPDVAPLLEIVDFNTDLVGYPVLQVEMSTARRMSSCT